MNKEVLQSANQLQDNISKLKHKAAEIEKILSTKKEKCRDYLEVEVILAYACSYRLQFDYENLMMGLQLELIDVKRKIESLENQFNSL